ncbi:MAG: hypothetical protein JWR19_2452 [Pedosphaera sp.]|nr:hypothetical protein [Pedosphaera sp.]
MNKTYVIYWKSKVNGRTGTGTTFFERAEAERLAEELNRDYPEIDHEAREMSLAEQAQEALPVLHGEQVFP